MTVLAIPRGPNVTKDGETHWVFSSCDRFDVAYWCETHQESFPTKDHLVTHIGDVAGDHAVARWCSRHGFEHPPEKSEVRE